MRLGRQNVLKGFSSFTLGSLPYTVSPFSFTYSPLPDVNISVTWVLARLQRLVIVVDWGSRVLVLIREKHVGLGKQEVYKVYFDILVVPWIIAPQPILMFAPPGAFVIYCFCDLL